MDEEEVLTWSNHYQIDPRQQACWDYFIDPKSDTFGNAYRSAIKAGLPENKARVVSGVDWFKARCRKSSLLPKAEAALAEALEYEVMDSDGKRDANIARAKLDAAKFVASTLGKREGFSSRTEITGADGKDLPTPILNIPKEE